jgi:hypothetical protein
MYWTLSGDANNRAMGKAIIDPTLDGWRFYLEEVSNGVFRVDGEHTDGRTVSRTGPQREVLKRSIEDARNLREIESSSLGAVVTFLNYRRPW